MNLAKVDRIIEKYQSDKAWLIMILQDIQQEFNYLPREALAHVAQRLQWPLSHVYRVATFYASLSLEERGRNLIHICDGTACHMRGAVNLRDEIQRELKIEPGETTEDKMFTLETVACLGACALAPVMAVGSKFYGKLTPEKVRTTLRACRTMPQPAQEQ